MTTGLQSQLDERPMSGQAEVGQERKNTWGLVVGDTPMSTSEETRTPQIAGFVIAGNFGKSVISDFIARRAAQCTTRGSGFLPGTRP